jgi:hypothetical protein
MAEFPIYNCHIHTYTYKNVLRGIIITCEVKNDNRRHP